MVHISGPMNDRLNQGCVRPHTRAGPGSPNADICVANDLVELFDLYPAKLSQNRGAMSAIWRNGGGIPPPHMTALLRSTVAGNGRNPPSFSLHSLRAGGATAMYRATKDIDLSALSGRWGTQSISAYLWASHQMMDGEGDHMVMGGPYDTRRGKFPGKNEETRPCFPASRSPQGGYASPGSWQ